MDSGNDPLSSKDSRSLRIERTERTERTECTVVCGVEFGSSHDQDGHV